MHAAWGGVLHSHGRSSGKLMLQSSAPTPASLLLASRGCGTFQWHKQNTHQVCLCKFTTLVLVDALQYLQEVKHGMCYT